MWGNLESTEGEMFRQPPNVLTPMDCKTKRGPEPGPPANTLPQIYGPQKLTTDKIFAVVSHGQVWS